MAKYLQQRGIPCRLSSLMTRDNANRRFAVRMDPSVAVGLDGLPAVTLTQAEPEVFVVDGRDLTQPLRIDDDLSGITAARTLRAQLTGAVLTAINANITVRGTDAGGTARTHIYRYTLANLTLVQHTTLAFATITQVSGAGFAAGTADITANARVMNEVFGEYQTFDKSATHIRNSGTMILRATEPYTRADNGFGVIAGYVAGEVISADTLGQGFGRIIGGGTENINGVDVNVYKVLNPEQPID